MRKSTSKTRWAVALAITAACGGSGEDQVSDPIALGMTDKLAPLFGQGPDATFQVETEVVLPMRKPTADERKGLGASPPFPRAPFLHSTDVELTLRYTLSNLDDREHMIELLINPWNEFVRYRPAIRVSEESTSVDFSGYDKFILLPPKSRVEGVLTPDDTRELAIDLATAETIFAAPPTGAELNVNGLMNHVFNLQNRSNGSDPLIAAYRPTVVPGLVGFDVGLRSGGAANVAIEVIVDVVDREGNRTTPSGAPNSDKIGRPGTDLTPPPPPQN